MMTIRFPFSRITRIAAISLAVSSSVMAAGWKPLGPAPQANGYDFLGMPENVSGRVSATAWAPDIDGAGTSAFFLGAAGGGVWRSTDYASPAPHWIPTTDNLGLAPATECGAIDVGCITVDTARHPNIIYVGTGEPNFSADSRYGAGILKSSDGGNTWTLLGASTFTKKCISRIIVDPSDPTGRTLYASMVYGAGGLGANYGVFKSTDGGVNWTPKNGLLGASAVVTDMEYTVSPQGAATLYAAVGSVGGSAFNGIYRSTNGGDSWTPVAGVPSGAGVGRISMAASHTPGANPALYVLAAKPDGTALGVYGTTNGGATWTTSYPGSFVGYQGWYNLAIGLANDGTVYLGGVSYPFNYGQGVLESTDGGLTWIAIDEGTNGETPHTDLHTFTAVGDVMYSGNDGGLWRYSPNVAHTQALGAPRHSETGGNALGVATGLFNADTIQDVAVTSYYESTVKVMLGNGDGTFGAPVSYAAGANPYQVVAADFNKDTKADLAVCNAGAGTVSVLLGNGNGTFGVMTTLTVGAFPYSIASDDLNGDTNADIVTANGSGTVSVLLGNGLGGFAAALNTAVSNGLPYSIATGDFSKDGKVDVAVADYANSTITVMAGGGAGQFGTKLVLNTSAGPGFVAAGDVNGDSKPDILSAEYDGNDLNLFTNAGTTAGALSFNGAVVLPTPPQPNAAIITSLNGDGFSDIVSANGSNSVSVWMGTAPGTFGARTDYAGGPEPLTPAVADFNGDAKPDIVTANWGNTVSVHTNGTAVVKGPSVWDNLNTTGLETIQMQGMALHPTDPDVFVEGSQDNGTARRDATTGNVWATVYGGDGGMARFDPLNGNFAYKVAPKGSLGANFFQVSSDSGRSWSGRTSTIYPDSTFPGGSGTRQMPVPSGLNDPGTFPFYPVFAVDPLDGQRVVIGSAYIYETRDRGATWTQISGAINSTWAITSLAYAPGNDNVIYAGYANGKVFRTGNDGGVWTDASGGSPWGNRRINGIAVDSFAPNTAYVAVPTHTAGRVWKTTNGGANWSDISASLPAVPANSLAIDPRTGILYVGADLGVWATADSGAHWSRYGSNLPNAQVLDLTLNTTTNLLGVATHGRGGFAIGIMPGDLNGDNILSTADAVSALRITGGLQTAAGDEALRGNLAPATTGITLEDAVAIIRKINGL